MRERFSPRDDRGQSLIEALVAITIIMTAVASSLTLVSSTINASRNSETLLVAGNLAREGIEVVRFIRDSNWLSGAAWDTGLAAATGTDYTGIPVFTPAANTWAINFTPNAIGDNAPVSTRVYRYNASGSGVALGLMVQAASQPASPATSVTVFRRLVTIDPLCASGMSYVPVSGSSTCGVAEKIGVRVTSTVQWQVSGKAKSVTIEERLFNWR